MKDDELIPSQANDEINEADKDEGKAKEPSNDIIKEVVQNQPFDMSNMVKSIIFTFLIITLAIFF